MRVVQRRRLCARGTRSGSSGGGGSGLVEVRENVVVGVVVVAVVPVVVAVMTVPVAVSLHDSSVDALAALAGRTAATGSTAAS